MNERFIVVSHGQYGGYWGAGETISDAKLQLKKAGGKLSAAIYGHRFTSELPFAPADREANEGEADCFMTSQGSIRYIKCDHEELGKLPRK